MNAEHSHPAMLLKIPEAARALNISKSLAYLMVASGELPKVRIGRAVRVPVAELERYIADKLRQESPMSERTAEGKA